MPLCTAPALGLLTGTARLPNRLPRVENAACGFSTGLPHGGQRYAVDHPTFQNARTGSPVRRVSGVGVDGVGSHGCDESCAGTWTAHRSGPLERRRSERTRNAAKRNTRPDAGSAFSLFTFSLRKQRESKTPCRRNLYPGAEESATVLLGSKVKQSAPSAQPKKQPRLTKPLLCQPAKQSPNKNPVAWTGFLFRPEPYA